MLQAIFNILAILAGIFFIILGMQLWNPEIMVEGFILLAIIINAKW